MCLSKFSRSAMSSVEYGIMVAVLVMAVLAMNGYVRRVLAGRIKTNVDSTLGKPIDLKGSYESESYSGGSTAFLSRIETKDGKTAAEAAAKETMDVVGYQVLGAGSAGDCSDPTSSACVIKPDAKRGAYTSTSSTTSVYDWSVR